MHYTSYAPTRCHERGCNACENGFPWHPLNCDAKNGEGSPVPSFNMNRHLDFNKEVLSQIIQKHEATFRYQLQELHRLYRKQRELMDEIRVSQIYTQHLQFQTPELNKQLPQPRLEISQMTSHPASWILGNNPNNLSLITTKDTQGQNFAADSFQNSIMSGHGLFPTKNKHNEAKSFSSRSECHGTRIWNLQHPADVYLDSDEVVNVCKYPAQDSGLDPVEVGDFPNSDIKQGSSNFLIDLNEPVLLEPMESGSTTSFEPYVSRKEVMCNCPVVYRVDELKSVAENLMIGIDLNLMPLSCSSEAVITVENPPKSDGESKVEVPSRTKQDCYTRIPSSPKNELSFDSGVVSNSSSVHDHPTSKGMLGEDPTSDGKISDQSLKTKTQVVMSTSIILEETFPSLSSTKFAMESAKEIDLEAPVSPANKEGFPPRAKSEDALLEATPLLPEQRKREPEIELDAIAAETLILMSYSGALDINLGNCLYWFSDIVSSTCGVNDLENRVVKRHNYATAKDRQKLCSDGTCDSKIKKAKQSQKNDVNLSRAANEYARGRNSCSKPKNSKPSCRHDKKSATSILKDLRPVSWGWGKIKKRQGAHRRRASKFLVIR